MKIVIDARWVRNCKIDGIGRYVMEMARNILMEDKANEYLLLFSSDADRVFFEEKIGSRFNYLILPFDILSFKDILLLPRRLRKLKTDIFLSPNYLTSPFHSGYQTVLVVHDFIPYFFDYARASIFWKIYFRFKFQTKIILSMASKIIADSGSTARDAEALFGIRGDKISVVYGGVNPRFQALPSDLTIGILRRLNLTPGYILYVGRQDPTKNIVGLIKAYYSLPINTRENRQLLIVGKKNERYFPGLSSLVKRLGVESRIIFIDYLSDDELVAIYNLAALFVYPSLYEGFGLPLLEAMACGCPVVASNIASLPEVCGDAAYYVDPYSVEDIAEGMYKALTDEDLKKSLKELGHKRVKQFSWQRSAEETIKIYKDIVNK